MSSFNFRWTGQHNDEPSQKTFQLTHWDNLLDIAKQLSGNHTCVYHQGSYHAGGRHIVRRIEVRKGQGELWLARIPTVHATSVAVSEWWTEEQKFTMESEIATMKYVAQTTDIPVPKVFGYDTSMDGNLVGLPYLLIQCIKGNMLYDLDDPVALTDEQNAKIRHSIASIQSKLATVSLRKLGSLVLKPNGDVGIGPLPAEFGFKGPFDSTADYFFAWSDHNPVFKNLDCLPDPCLRKAAESFPRRLKLTIEEKLLPVSRSDGDYPIVHPDFLMHNILLDDEYDVVGVIDWEYAHTAPIEVFAAQTNMYAAFDPERACLAWGEEGRQYLADIVREERGNDSSQSRKLSQAFGSLLGDLGFCMRLFEQGIAVQFDSVLDHAQNSFK